MAEPGPLRVSVVAPTYNRRDRLEGWVEAVLADPDVDELVVVVDGSADGSFELLESLAGRDARLVPVLVDNGGQFPALQAGVERARGDVVVFLDDDVVPPAGLAGAHARHHADGGRRVVLGYMPVRLPPRRADTVATFVYARQYEVQCDEYEDDPSTILTSFWAGNFSMRRTLALEIGLARPGDEGQFPYHPDRDFGLRCRAAGVEGVFDRSLRADHLHTRAVGAIVAEARSRAAGAVNLHRRHQAELGRWRPDRYGASLRAPLRAVVRLGRLAPIGGVLRWVLAGLLRIAGVARAYRLQDALAVLLINVVEVRTGMVLTADRRRRSLARPSAAAARRLHAVLLASPARALAGWAPLVRAQQRVQHGMPAEEVLAVLDALRRAGVDAWVSGGWGVDALAGRQRRAHLDLDLAVDARAGGDDRAVAALGALGYEVVDAYTEVGAGLPERVILHGPAGRQIDLHPFAGPGHFAGVAEEPFATGRIAGQPVPCLAAAVQLRYHQDYPARPVDRFDVADLRRRA